LYVLGVGKTQSV